MDIQLPIVDGYEATRQIRANPDMKAVPIIAVTSYALAGDEAKAEAAGCNAYVSKPFSPRALLAKVREYLDSKSAFMSDQDYSRRLGGLGAMSGYWPTSEIIHLP